MVLSQLDIITCSWRERASYYYLSAQSKEVSSSFINVGRQTEYQLRNFFSSCATIREEIAKLRIGYYFYLHSCTQWLKNRQNSQLLSKKWAGLDSSTILDVLISSTVYDKYCQHFLAMLKYINSFQYKIGIIFSMLSYTNGLCKVSKTDIKSCLVSTTL